MHSSVSDGEIHIESYSVVSKDRNRNGGGVCVYVRNDYALTVRSINQMDNDELIFVELLLPKTKPIIIGTVYRPSKQNDFLSSFGETLTHLTVKFSFLVTLTFAGLKRSSRILKSYKNPLKLL